MITPEKCRSGKAGVQYRLRLRRKGVDLTLMVGPDYDEAVSLAGYLCLIVKYARRDLMEALLAGYLTLHDVRRDATESTIAKGTFLPPPMPAATAPSVQPVSNAAMPQPVPTVGHAMAAFWRHVRNRGTLSRRGGPYTRGTIRRYLTSLRLFLYIIGVQANGGHPLAARAARRRAAGLGLDALQAQSLLEAFKKARLSAGTKWTTLNKDLIALSAWVAYMRQQPAFEAYAPIVPRKRKDNGPMPRCIEPQHLDAARAALEAPWSWIVDVLAGAGMRARELLLARTSQVQFDGAYLVIVDAKTGGEPRPVHLTVVARSALAALHADAVAQGREYLMPEGVFQPPLTASDASLDRCARAAVKATGNAWAKAQAKVGLHDCGAAWVRRHPEQAKERKKLFPGKPVPTRYLRARHRLHDLRHTCATLMVVAGWNIEEVREQLGHAGLGTTQRYSKAAGAIRKAGGEAYARMHYSPSALPNNCPTPSPVDDAQS